jgi:hypothetical protein
VAESAAEGGGPRSCPSALAEPGNLLYGRVRDGVVERLGTPLPVNQAFVDAVAAQGPPEQRFRFAGACLEGGCGQWENGGCGVIERVLRERPAEASGLPRCFIRASCRWFAQRGAVACAACSTVITDTRTPVAPAAR